MSKNNTTYKCDCGKEYSHRSSLSRHQSTCKALTKPMEAPEVAPSNGNGKAPVDIPSVRFYDYRCPGCGRLQFRAHLAKGTVIKTVCWHGNCKRHIKFMHGPPLKANVSVINANSY